MHLLSSRKQTTRAAGGSSLAFSSAWWGGSVVGARLARTERKQGRHLTRVCGRGNNTGLPREMARGAGQFRYKGKDRSSYLGGGELKGAGHPKGLRPAPACASVLGACPAPDGEAEDGASAFHGHSSPSSLLCVTPACVFKGRTAGAPLVPSPSGAVLSLFPSCAPSCSLHA